jgi:hypothetical protein
MKNPLRVAGLLVLLFLAVVVFLREMRVGYTYRETRRSQSALFAQAAEAAAPPAVEPKRTKLADHIWLEQEGEDRRVVVVEAKVCLRSGEYGLECLLCKRGTKEHESILTTPANAQFIHAALLAAGAQPGSPVQFEPEFKSPTGTPIKISLRYQKKGETVTVPARKWIRYTKTKKELDHDWVFTGSILWKDPDDKDKPAMYLANVEGGYIATSNVASAMLDLPVNSPKALEQRAFEPNTELIPDLETRVEILLEPERRPKK